MARNDAFNHSARGGNYRPGDDLIDHRRGKEEAQRRAESAEYWRRQFLKGASPPATGTSWDTGRDAGAPRASVESPAWLLKLSTAVGVVAALIMGWMAFRSTTEQPLIVAAIAAAFSYGVTKYGILVLYELARWVLKAMLFVVPFAFFMQWLTGYPLGSMLLNMIPGVGK